MANWYIAQTAVGTGNGTTPENAAAPTFYNSAGNWQSPKVAGKIGPGDTVYLIGTITTALVPPLSGTNGASIITAAYDTSSKVSGNIIGVDVASKDDTTISGLSFFGQTGANARPISVSAGAERVLIDDIEIDGNDTATFGITLSGAGLGVTISNTSIDKCSVSTGRGISIASVTSSNILIENVETDGCGSGLYVSASPANIDIDGLTVKNGKASSSYGGIYVVGALASGAKWENVAVEGTLYTDGVKIIGGSNLEIDGISISGTKSPSNIVGYGMTISSNVSEASSNILIDHGLFYQNENDGVALLQATNAMSNIRLVRCKFYENGKIGDIARGDGFTSHGAPTACSVDFSLAYANTNDAVGIVDSGQIKIRHMTGLNNGSAGAVRAECFVTSSGECDIRNCAFCNTNGYPVAEIKNNPGTHTWDHNVYLSTITGAFKIETVAKTFAQWVATTGYDTNSWFIHEHDGQWDCYHGSAPSVVARTLSARPIDIASGRLVNVIGSPLIKSATVITDVNDGGELDIWGNATTIYPNIGADQQDYAPGFGPWAAFGESMPALTLAPTCPGSLKQVQEWRKVATAREIGEL